MVNYSWSSGSSRYELIKSSLNFSDAQIAANNAGGFLAEINSADENLNVFTNVSSQISTSEYRDTTALDGGGSAYVWLGGSDSTTEGVWKWMASGDEISLARSEWGSGALGQEPDNYNNQDGLGLGLENWPSGSLDNQGYGNAGSWNDIDLSNNLFYVVEFDQVLDPEPTPEPQPEPTPEPTPEPQPEPTPEPQPEPTPEPQPEPTPEPEPEDYEPPTTENKIDGTKKADVLKGTKKSDFINGKKGDDSLTGKKGSDHLQGGSGQDFLTGAKGNDYLDGSKGIDTLNGGKGADVFKISKGIDLVEDFSLKQGDRIALDKKGKYSIVDDPDGVLIMASAKKQLFLDGVDYDDVIATGVDLFVQPV